jgi:hypothetical protein
MVRGLTLFSLHQKQWVLQNLQILFLLTNNQTVLEEAENFIQWPMIKEGSSGYKGTCSPSRSGLCVFMRTEL